jgi:hypothetical protein
LFVANKKGRSLPGPKQEGGAPAGGISPGSVPPPPVLEPEVLAAMSEALHEVAGHTIEAVVAEVPGYRGTLDAGARATLAGAVELALGGFLALAAEQQQPSAPLTPALEGAYALGRGEARAGRSMDALLAAYRVGARVSWRGLAGAAAGAGLSAEALVGFAELVFAYIDRLSAASVAGHADELAVEDRMRQRHLERLGHGLVTGSSEELLVAAAQRAGWAPPESLVAVVLPDDRVDDVLARIDPRTLQPVEDVPGLEPGEAVLLVPTPGPRFEAGLRRGLAGAPATIGPTRPWLSAQASYDRAIRAWRSLPRAGITRSEDLLPELVVSADPEALADLRARALAPLATLRPAAAARLQETLRAWLLHRGRRDEVAAALFVHPQTIRYRMGQVRELFGDRLDDPRGMLELTIALAIPPEGPRAVEPGPPTAP